MKVHGGGGGGHMGRGRASTLPAWMTQGAGVPGGLQEQGDKANG